MKSNEQFIKENVSTVRKGYQMMETMLKIIDILQHSDYVAGTALEKQINTPVKTSLDWLEQFGKVKAENRKEEFITVTKKEYIWPDNNIGLGHWEKVKKQVQVTRKYYKWVG